MSMSGEYGRFEPPYCWKQRFSSDELKELYFKLFKYDEFHAKKGVFSFERPYDICTNGNYGYVVLKDGGRARLEYVEMRDLDWLLYNGYEFGFETNNRYKPICKNPLYCKTTKEEVMISLDIFQVQ